MDYEIEVFRKYFPGAEIEALRFGGWRIHTLTGFVEYKDGRFPRTVGGPDIYRGMCQCAKEFGWTFIVLKAPEKHKNDQHILACMAHGAEVGIDVVVEVQSEDEGCLFCMMCFAIWALVAWLGSLLLNGWVAMVVSIGVTKLVVSKFIEPEFDRWMVRNERQRGQIYRNVLPKAHGDVGHPLQGSEIARKYFEP
jgi:hypothetical protein